MLSNTLVPLHRNNLSPFAVHERPIPEIKSISCLDLLYSILCPSLENDAAFWKKIHEVRQAMFYLPITFPNHFYQELAGL